ncbi:MAG: sugar transferase [Turicibacter sp.]|nr:sugar transferase [Turicibacter sp.]
MISVEHLDANEPKKKNHMPEKYIINVKRNPLYDFFSRWVDILFALVLGIFSGPVILLFALLVRIEDNGPSFYKQERLGKDGEKFWIYKLRSMRMDAEKYGMQWAERDDPRVTKVGKFIRLTRIDELPQVLNLLNGDMKLIGPRPERPELTYQFEEETPGFMNRLVVKPGVTGWAQVNGGYEITPAEKAELDIYYIKHRTFLMDIKIILKTIKVVLTGEGAR